MARRRKVSTGRAISGALLEGVSTGLGVLAETKQAEQAQRARDAGVEAKKREAEEAAIEKRQQAVEAQENEQILQNLSDVGVDPTDAAAQFFGQFREEAGFTPASGLTPSGRQAQAAGVQPFFEQLGALADEDVVGQTQAAPGELSPELLSVLSQRVGERRVATRKREAIETAEVGAAAKAAVVPTFAERLAKAEEEQQIKDIVGGKPQTPEEVEAEAVRKGRLDGIRQVTKDKYVTEHGTAAKPKWTEIEKLDRRDVLTAANEAYENLGENIKEIVGFGTLRNTGDLRAIWKASTAGGAGWRRAINRWFSGEDTLSDEDRASLRAVVALGAELNSIGSRKWRANWRETNTGPAIQSGDDTGLPTKEEADAVLRSRGVPIP